MLTLAIPPLSHPFWFTPTWLNSPRGDRQTPILITGFSSDKYHSTYLSTNECFLCSVHDSNPDHYFYTCIIACSICPFNKQESFEFWLYNHTTRPTMLGIRRIPTPAEDVKVSSNDTWCNCRISRQILSQGRPAWLDIFGSFVPVICATSFDSKTRASHQSFNNLTQSHKLAFRVYWICALNWRKMKFVSTLFLTMAAMAYVAADNTVDEVSLLSK